MPINRSLHVEWPIFRWVRLSLELGGGFAIVQLLIYAIATNSYLDLAKAIVPIMATYIATASLFYNRARAIGSGKSRNRSLYAAERSMQGVVFTIIGLLLGAIVYYLLTFFHISIVFSGRQTEDPWIMAYTPAFAFILMGYVTYLLALRAISKEFLRPITVREICERVNDKDSA